MSGPQDRSAPDLKVNAAGKRLLADTAANPVAKRIMLIIPGRLFRNGIEAVLRGTGSHIVSDCETLAEAETVLATEAGSPPDLFVVGMDVPERTMDDFTRIRALRAKFPEARWIVLSNFGGPEFWWQAVDSRIDGLLHQDSPGEVLQLLVRLILLGYSFLPTSPALVPGAAALSDRPLAQIAAPDPAIFEIFKMKERTAVPGAEATSRWRAGLSERESEILRGLVAGLSNKSIARELMISEATVKVHVKALLRKMQVTNRTQAAISALQFLNKPPQEPGSLTDP